MAYIRKRQTTTGVRYDVRFVVEDNRHKTKTFLRLPDAEAFLDRLNRDGYEHRVARALDEKSGDSSASTLLVAINDLRRRVRGIERLLNGSANDEYAVSAPRRIAPALVTAVRRRDDYVCQWCKRAGTSRRDPDGKDWHIDHVMPVALGGADVYGNLVMACARCNLAKSDAWWGWPDNPNELAIASIGQPA